MALFLKIFLKWYELFVCQSETAIFCSENLETISLHHKAGVRQIEHFLYIAEITRNNVIMDFGYKKALTE